MRKYFLLLFFILQSFRLHSFGQQHGIELIDSLQHQLSITKVDTAQVDLLVMISRAYKYVNADTALHYSNKAMALATKLNYEMGVANSKIGIGALYNWLGRHAEGAGLANDALVIYNKHLSTTPPSLQREMLKRIGNAYIVIGQNKLGQGNYPEALKYTLLAIKTWEVYGELTSISNAQWNISIIYSNQHNYPQALKYMYDCLEISKQTKDTSSMAGCHAAIAYVNAEMNDFEQAYKNDSIALMLAEKINDNFTIAEIYTNLGEYKGKEGKYNEALEYNLAALKKYGEVGMEAQFAIIHNNIATVYIKQKKYPAAAESLTTALQHATKTNNSEYIKLVYQNWAILDSSQGNYQKAWEHYKLYITYRDSLLNKENTKKLVQTEMQYDFDKKEEATKKEQEQKDAITLQEIKQQRTIRNISFAGMVALVLFGGFTYSRYLQRKKLSNQLSQSLVELKQTQNQLIQLEKEKEAEAIRLRISRDIHDDIGSNLTKIAMLGNLTSAQAKDKLPEVSDQLNKISNYARNVNSSMSEIIWAVNPKQDTLENLLGYMRVHTQEFLKDSDIQYQINFPETVPHLQLNPDLKRALFLVLKESLNNIVKHANAKNTILTFSLHNQSFELLIADDGKGFSRLEANEKAGGNGLNNLEERMKQVGCDVVIQSAPSNGTTIKVSGILV